MKGGDAQNYPQFEDRHKQEAARFLGAGPENLRPMLRGMISFERLDAWTEVAKEMDVDETERRMLRKHRVPSQRAEQRRRGLLSRVRRSRRR